MKLNEQFIVAESPQQLWKLLDQPKLVASCLPGVEAVEVLNPDDIRVRVSQSIGPMSATFDARVRIVERIEGQSIRFIAVGKSVRGAVGTVRATNTVTLTPAESGTRVTLDSDLALAGALGSVGQKVVAKQASQVTAQFADNLRRLLAGEISGAAADTAAPPQPAAPRQLRLSRAELPEAASRHDRWVRASFAMSATSAALSLAVLIRLRRAPQ